MQRVKRFGVLSVAKIMGIIYGAMGLLLIPFFLLGSSAMLLQKDIPHAGGAMAMGLVFAVMAPVVYGVMGFLFGAFSAWLYNLIANKVGGIEIQLEVFSENTLPR
jgi:hypothetical protein